MSAAMETAYRSLFVFVGDPLTSCSHSVVDKEKSLMSMGCRLLRERWTPLVTAEALGKAAKRYVMAGWEPSVADEYDALFTYYAENATPGPAKAAARAVWVNKLVSGRVLLLGDSAHCLSPNLGLGMNLGFEDVYILAAFLTGAAPSDEALANKPRSLAQAI